MSHPQGIIGVVVDSRPKTGGVLVHCEHGLICSTDQLLDFWIPHDRYSVRAKAGDDFVLSDT